MELYGVGMSLGASLLTKKIANHPEYFKKCVMIGNPFCVKTAAEKIDQN